MEDTLKLILSELQELKAGQKTLEAGQAELAQEVREAKQRVATVETKVLHELGIIRENVTSLGERNRQLDLIDSKVEDHEHRLFAIEESLKKAE